MVNDKNVMNAIRIFISYSDKDENLLQDLEAHLSSLKRLSVISCWYKNKIIAGERYYDEINEHLKSSNLVLLLISADFIASDYCYNTELEKALQRYKTGQAWIIPIILRAVRWENTPIGVLQPLPSNGLAITSWLDRDAAYLDVVRGIEKAILELAKTHHILQLIETERFQFQTNAPIPIFSEEQILKIKESASGRRIRHCKLSIQKLQKQISDISLRNIYGKKYDTLKRDFDEIRKSLRGIKEKEAIRVLIKSLDQLYEDIEEALFYLEAFFALSDDVLLEIDKNDSADINIEEIRRIVDEFYSTLQNCQKYLTRSLQQFVV